jgi:hypothetical protein
VFQLACSMTHLRFSVRKKDNSRGTSQEELVGY